LKSERKGFFRAFIPSPVFEIVRRWGHDEKEKELSAD